MDNMEKNMVYCEKIEIKLLPNAVKTLENICKKTGVSKSEVIEKLFLTYIPLEKNRAVEVIIDDIETRTQSLTDEQKRYVYEKILEYITNIE